MWMLLSTRLRTWLALAVALPVARMVLRRLAARATRQNPNSRLTGLLNRGDATVTTMAQRRRGRRGR
ncbi:MAG: hypothetical protein QOE71_4192 [Pseudonocardiales bacterium]|jgi:hypothetical protein|nr:hypothetical protein [Pseudonocardiales bacterium]MDQ1753136.1 hypothetical protein [Pseudonocardiales bacterium]